MVQNRRPRLVALGLLVRCCVAEGGASSQQEGVVAIRLRDDSGGSAPRAASAGWEVSARWASGTPSSSACSRTFPYPYDGSGVPGGYCCDAPHPRSNGNFGALKNVCAGAFTPCTMPPCHPHGQQAQQQLQQQQQQQQQQPRRPCYRHTSVPGLWLSAMLGGGRVFMVRHFVDESDTTTGNPTVVANLDSGWAHAPAGAALTAVAVTAWWEARTPAYGGAHVTSTLWQAVTPTPADGGGDDNDGRGAVDSTAYAVAGLRAVHSGATPAQPAAAPAHPGALPAAAAAVPPAGRGDDDNARPCAAANPLPPKQQPTAADNATLAIWGHGDMHHWCTYTSDEVCELFFIELRARHGWVVFEEGMRVDVLVFIERYADVLAHHDRLMAGGDVGAIAFWNDDVHWGFGMGRKAVLTQVYSLPLIFAQTYPWAAEWWHPQAQIAGRALWLPHAASSRFLRPVNRSAAFSKAMLAGTSHPLFYPYRWAAKEVAEAGGPITTQEQAGVGGVDYGHHAGALAAKRSAYADKMAGYGVGITGCSAIQYVIAKVFEIPAAGQLLLVNAEVAPLLRELCLVDGEHYVGYHSFAHMEAQVEFALDPANRAEVDRIRKNGHDLVARAHSTRARALQMDRMMRCVHAARAGAPVTKGGLRAWVGKCAIWKFDPSSVQKTLTQHIVDFLERRIGVGSLDHADLKTVLEDVGIVSKRGQTFSQPGVCRGCECAPHNAYPGATYCDIVNGADTVPAGKCCEDCTFAAEGSPLDGGHCITKQRDSRRVTTPPPNREAAADEKTVVDRIIRCTHAARASAAVTKDGLRAWVEKCMLAIMWETELR